MAQMLGRYLPSKCKLPKFKPQYHNHQKKKKKKKNYDCGFKSLNSGMVCYATKASG
jgi:hypothetical protein